MMYPPLYPGDILTRKTHFVHPNGQTFEASNDMDASFHQRALEM